MNQGNGSFTDRAGHYGVSRGGWGWAATLSDFDNDGDEDLFHATSTDVPIRNWSRLGYISPVYWERTSEGFERRNSTKLGFDATNGRGIATLDYDSDGRLDLVVADSGPFSFKSPSIMEGKNAIYRDYKLYENRGPKRNWLQLRIAGNEAHPVSIGARVKLTAGNLTIIKQNNARSDYLSQETRMLHFGLGEQRQVSRIQVVWPDGTTRSFKNISANQRLVITPNGITPAEETNGTLRGSG
jgi:hypothetical protein